MTGDNVVVPLDDLMVDEKYGLGGSEVAFDAPTKDEIVPQFLEECRLGGHTYALPYMRTYHPSYEALGGVPAIQEVQFSIIHNRGCFGACNFCALAFHQGATSRRAATKA